MSKYILIATASKETVSTHFNSSLVEAMQYLNMRAAELDDVKYAYQAFFTSSPVETKSNIVKFAKKVNATHIIWVDSNMMFPPETFFNLISHDKDFVAVNYSTNRAPFKFTALTKNEQTEDYDIVPTIEDTTGLQKISGVKLGLCITSIACFDDNKKPWFNYTYNKENDDYLIDEDYTFCFSLGGEIDLYIDHDLSKSVRNVGWFPYHYKCPYQNAFAI